MKMNEEKEHIPVPFELFGIECGKGWYKLIEPILKYVEEYNKDKEKENQIEFLQIKEKWGGLRIYTNFGTKELFELIDNAEEESFKTCEFCGSEENVGCTENGWYSTVCLDCVKKMAKERGYPQAWRKNENNILYQINPDGNVIQKNEKLTNPKSS